MKKKLLVLFQLVFMQFTFGQTANPYWQIFTSGSSINDIDFHGDTAWVTSTAGISKIVSGTGLIENYNTLNCPLRTNYAYNIACGNNGLWVSSYEEWYLYFIHDYDILDASKWERFNYSPSSGLAIDSSDNMFFVARDTVVWKSFLYKYDGNIFTTYDSISHLVSAGSIRKIMNDYNGNVWIQANNFLFKENGNSWDLIDSTLPSYPFDPDVSIAPDGTPWCTLSRPFRVGKLMNNGWQYYDSTSFGLFNITTNSRIYADQSGNIWTICNTQNNVRYLLKYDGLTWTTFDSSNTAVLNSTIREIKSSPSGNLWFAGNGVLEYDGTNWTNYDAYPSIPFTTMVESVKFDKSDNAWIETGRGIYKKTGNVFSFYYTDCNDFTVDTNDVVWVTPRNLNADSSSMLKHLDGSIWISDSSITGHEGHICSDGNNVKWIVDSDVGLYKYSDSIIAFYNSSNSPLSPGFPWFLYSDQSNNLWIPSYYTLQKFDGNTWTTWNTRNFSFPLECVHGLTEDRSGNVWGWCYSGSSPTTIAKYNGQTWSAFQPQAGIPYDRPMSIVFDHNNNMWVAFGGKGLGMYDGASWTVYTPDNSPLTALQDVHLNVDRFNNIYMSDVYDGLTIFNPDGIQFNNPAPTSQRVIGQIFHDADSNAVFDSTESGMNNQRLLLLPDSTIITTNSTGKFVRNLFAGDYEIQVLPFPGWNVSTDSLSYHIHVDSSSITIPDFGLNATPFHRVEITQNSGMLYCGYQSRIWINYTNMGSVVDSGEVILKFDTIADYYSGVPVANLFGDSVAIWNFIDLIPFETRTITSDMILAYRPNLIFSSMAEVHFKVDTTVVASDAAFQTDSVYCYDDEITALLNAFPVGTGSQHIVSVTDTMYYTIRFQNTTHDSISYLSIVDTLDLNFNLASFQIIASSHYMNYSFNNNLLTFSFPAINLPDSAVDFLDSQGFITFSVIPKNTTPHLTVVPNSAQVSYDYSTFVQTNEVFNTIYQNGIGIDEISGSLLQIYPNPAGNILNVFNSAKTNTGFSIEIADMLGRKVFSKKMSSNENQIDLNRLTNGIYIVSIIDCRLEKIASKRLVVQK